MLESLTKIQHALTDRIEGRDVIRNRSVHIRSLVDSFQKIDADDSSRKSVDVLKESYRSVKFRHDHDSAASSDREINEFEDTATAYLLYQLKQEAEEKDEHFDLREAQIESIIALLRKDHLQSPTGSGKSSVVLPIASLVKALSENGRIAVVSASDELTVQLQVKLTAYNNFLPDELKVSLNEGEKQTERKAEAVADANELAKKLMKKEVENVDVPDIARLEYKALFDRPARPKGIPEKSEKGEIVVFKDDDFVFWRMKNNKASLAHTYWDEIHVPYDRGSPYYISGEGIPTSNSVNNYLFERIISGAMADQIDTWEKGGLLEERKGIWDIKAGPKKGEEQGDRYEKRQNRFYEEFKKTLSKPLDTDIRFGEPTAVTDIVVQVAAKFGLDADALKQWFRKELNERIRNDQLEDIISEHELAIMRAKAIRAGKDYSLKEGHVVSRDPYMGISLPGRQYQADILLALQALEGEVDYFNFIKSAADMTTFEGFVANYLEGTVSGLSGTLMTPTLSDPTPEPSTLAQFLENYSNHHLFATEVAKPKYVPTPDYFEDETGRDTSLTNLIFANKRSVAIFAFDENEGDRLRKLLSERFADRAVVLVSDEDDEQEAQSKYGQFAEADGTILISTGRAGVGVDIKKKDNAFPDFLTVVHGLPQSRAQLFQILGRRRKEEYSEPDHPEKDFRWLFAKTDLASHDGIRQNRETHEIEAIISHFHTYLDAGPETYRGDILKQLDEILHRSESQIEEDDVIRVQFDRFYHMALNGFEKNIARRETTETFHHLTHPKEKPEEYRLVPERSGFKPFLDREKQNVSGGYFERIVENQFGPDEKQILEMLLPHLQFKENGYDRLKSFFYSYVGAPASLYYDLKNLLTYSQGETAAARMADFYQRAQGYFNSSEIFDDWLNLRSLEFVELMENTVSYLDHAYPKFNISSLHEAIQKGGKLVVLYLGNETQVNGSVPQKDENRVDLPNGTYTLFLNLQNPNGELYRIQLLTPHPTSPEADYPPLEIPQDMVLLPLHQEFNSFKIGLEIDDKNI